jgi:hypothetical protein
MSFSIKIPLTANQLRNAREANGVIVTGEFEETFTVPLEYWNAEDYRRHWKASLLKLLQKEDSCLITSMHDPEKANFICYGYFTVGKSK